MSKLLRSGEFYLIRHTPTDTFMPMTKHGRGFTQIETSEFIPFGSGAPRVFFDIGAANRALRAWLKGPWEAIKDSDIDDWTGRSYTYTSGGKPPKDPPSNRRPEDVDIATFAFSEVSESRGGA